MSHGATIELAAELDGKAVTLRLRPEDLERVALVAAEARAKRETPIVGYANLRDALARVGIHKGITTLQEWKRKRKLPCRKHNRDVVFYLDEVLARIGGREA